MLADDIWNRSFYHNRTHNTHGNMVKYVTSEEYLKEEEGKLQKSKEISTNSYYGEVEG